MPFNPNLPTEGTSTDAALMRAQLNALNDKIDAQQATIEAQATRIAALEAALADTARNPSMGEFDPSFADPPTTADLQNIQAYLNDLTSALNR